jgi:methyl-accepting chemotaxis protein
MGLRLKFNLILIAIFLAGFATVTVIAHRYLQSQAVDDARRAANMMLDTAAISGIDLRIATSLGSRIVEMKVREFDQSAPQSGAEGEAVRRLATASSNDTRNELADVIVTNQQKKLIVARQLTATDGIKKIRIVIIDYDAVTATAKLALTTLMSSLGLVFVSVFLVLNLMLDRLIVRPVAEMAKQAEAVSIGNFSVPEFTPTSRDEISVLGVAFNRMRRSTEEAIKLLKTG